MLTLEIHQHFVFTCHFNHKKSRQANVTQVVNGEEVKIVMHNHIAAAVWLRNWMNILKNCLETKFLYCTLTK